MNFSLDCRIGPEFLWSRGLAALSVNLDYDFENGNSRPPSAADFDDDDTGAWTALHFFLLPRFLWFLSVSFFNSTK